MTHEYTLLVGGVIAPGPDEPDVSAMAWAEGIVIALGSDDAIRSISRGDSRVVDLHGAVVLPLAPDGAATWPTAARIEIGGQADLVVFEGDPRLAPTHPRGGPVRRLALLRGGHVATGALPDR